MTSSNVAVVLKSNGATIRGKLIAVSPCHVPNEEWIRVDTGEEVHTIYRTDTLARILFDPHSLKSLTYSNGDQITYFDLNGKMIVVRVATYDNNHWGLGL